MSKGGGCVAFKPCVSYALLQALLIVFSSFPFSFLFFIQSCTSHPPSLTSGDSNNMNDRNDGNVLVDSIISVLEY